MPEAFAVYEDGQQVSPILTQRGAVDWITRNRPHVLGLREAFAMIRPTLDERDSALRAERQSARDSLPCVPLEGDVVRFGDGTEYRVSNTHLHHDGRPRVQTTTGGSFSWGSSGHMSYSGGLLSPIDGDTLTLAEDTADVPAWFFHHGHAHAHNAVHTTARVRVWETTSGRPA